MTESEDHIVVNMQPGTRVQRECNENATRVQRECNKSAKIHLDSEFTGH